MLCFTVYWTGRQGREVKKGKITADHAPILAKHGIAESIGYIEYVVRLGVELQAILWQESRARIAGTPNARLKKKYAIGKSLG